MQGSFDKLRLLCVHQNMRKARPCVMLSATMSHLQGDHVVVGQPAPVHGVDHILDLLQELF
jgi:hypothetical protein